VSVVTGRDETHDSGVPHAPALVGFADAVVRGDDDELQRTRDRVLEELGADRLVDAAAVASNFERMVRIADATGIPLDAPIHAITADLREDLGVDSFASARNTPPLGAILGAVGRAARPLAGLLFRTAGALAGRGRSDGKGKKIG
jgi:hypothetical protein